MGIFIFLPATKTGIHSLGFHCRRTTGLSDYEEPQPHLSTPFNKTLTEKIYWPPMMVRCCIKTFVRPAISWTVRVFQKCSRLYSNRFLRKMAISLPGFF